MKLLTILISAFLIQTSIYTLSVNKIDGSVINISSYEHKKILLVNIATGSQYSNQINELETFYQLHKDSIVVIGFPSNNFGYETNSNEQLGTILHTTYHVTFPIAAISSVSGANANPIYQWLQSREANGSMNGNVKGDFQKFLVNESGVLVGVFSPVVSVASQEFLEAINN